LTGGNVFVDEGKKYKLLIASHQATQQHKIIVLCDKVFEIW